MVHKTLNYVTYQSFPAETANSLQTISQIQEFVKQGLNVNLYFPLREQNSSGDKNKLFEFYEVKNKFNVYGLIHRYPFGKFQKFNKIWYHISHFLWSKKTSGTFSFAKHGDELFFTRSDWLLYFLAKKQLNIVFECHQYSKLRNFLLKRIAHLPNVKIIFLNDLIKSAFNIKFYNYLIAPSAVDTDIFSDIETSSKEKNSIIFVGNLLRFGKSRNIDELIELFTTNSNLQQYQLIIVGGPDIEASRINEKILNQRIKNIKVLGRKKRIEVFELLKKAKYGVLINSDDKHSKNYTSPLKYFEYLAAELKVLAIDYPSHKELPFQENIFYFNENLEESFLHALNLSSQTDFKQIDKNQISLETRTKKILGLYSK
jgi:hypothetical protein